MQGPGTYLLASSCQRTINKWQLTDNSTEIQLLLSLNRDPPVSNQRLCGHGAAVRHRSRRLP
jgi:hypothetical protein